MGAKAGAGAGFAALGAAVVVAGVDMGLGACWTGAEATWGAVTGAGADFSTVKAGPDEGLLWSTTIWNTTTETIISTRAAGITL